MNNFKDFNIKPKITSFVGDKIKMERIINVPIVVHDFKIGESIMKSGTKCLTLQIEKNGSRHIIFTSSKILIQQIKEVPKSNFPFSTTIIKDNEYFEFT
ncbi:hypothetical protein I215_01788 [Galbibacter marinus]|uniref:Uncharacterized protein n=1 Tax=Galbibacter marinus TaxID=555500 RepID=K2PXR1_9FLAO|nr:hypothetical protein [Galbibacter marinus]EKF56214.1 hypothetical protein I215_01788 [Galbibacter marinus]